MSIPVAVVVLTLVMSPARADRLLAACVSSIQTSIHTSRYDGSSCGGEFVLTEATDLRLALEPGRNFTGQLTVCVSAGGYCRDYYADSFIMGVSLRFIGETDGGVAPPGRYGFTVHANGSLATPPPIHRCLPSPPPLCVSTPFVQLSYASGEFGGSVVGVDASQR